MLKIFMENIDWLILTMVVLAEIFKGLPNKKLFLLAWYMGVVNCFLFGAMAVYDGRPGAVVLNIILLIIFTRHIVYWRKLRNADKIVEKCLIDDDWINEGAI
jgi:hypothetical protein